jgi:hypothetical protein
VLIQPRLEILGRATSCLFGKSYPPPSIPGREVEQRIFADLKESFSRGYSAPRCTMPEPLAVQSVLAVEPQLEERPGLVLSRAEPYVQRVLL